MAKYISGDLTNRKVLVNTFSAEFTLSWQKNDGFFSDTTEVDLTKKLCAVQITSEEKLQAPSGPKGLTSLLSGLGGGNFNIIAACMLTNGKKFFLQVNEEEYAKLELYAKLNIPAGGAALPDEQPTPPDTNETIELIKKLGELKDAELLTEEEFQDKKQQLLDKI